MDKIFSALLKLIFFSRPLEDDYFVGSVTVPVLTGLVFSPSFLEYSYCVIHGDSENSKTWEYFHSANETKNVVNRKLSIPLKYSLKGIIVQF